MIFVDPFSGTKMTLPPPPLIVLPVGTPMMLGGGLVEATGGDGFANNGSFERFVQSVWREATDYYLLGYWPSTDRREIHKVEVSSDWKGVHLRARKRR